MRGRLAFVVSATLAVGLTLPLGAAQAEGSSVHAGPTIAARPAAGTITVKVYPVPSSSAGLGRITTAPNGDMWFVERDKNKVGRITTRGAITEFNLPEQTVDDTWVQDVDVAADGKVWVVWDQGWNAIGFYPTSPGTGQNVSLFGNPYGEQVRIGPDGVKPWITMSYDEDGIAYISGGTAHWPDNAPECDGALGRGRDGHMWCAEFDNVTAVAADGNGGMTAALPDDATYPNSIAPGPNGAVWVGRDDQGSMFTYPGDGNIGWVNSNLTSHFIRLGSRVAPRSLVQWGSNVWFTSIGGVKGIGHINAAGVGAITQVGNYHPTSLTVGRDGAIWFTDNDHNVIVRVAPGYLGTTNVNLGYGSQLRPASAKRKLTLAKKVKTKGKKRVFKGKATSPWPNCRAGKVQVRRVKKHHKSVVVGHGKARKNGAYVVKVKKRKVKKGKYFTRILQTRPGGTLCAVANSPKRKVR